MEKLIYLFLIISLGFGSHSKELPKEEINEQVGYFKLDTGITNLLYEAMDAHGPVGPVTIFSIPHDTSVHKNTLFVNFYFSGVEITDERVGVFTRMTFELGRIGNHILNEFVSRNLFGPVSTDASLGDGAHRKYLLGREGNTDSTNIDSIKDLGTYKVGNLSVLQTKLNKIKWVAQNGDLPVNKFFNGNESPSGEQHYSLIHFKTQDLIDLMETGNTRELFLMENFRTFSNIRGGDGWDENTKFLTLTASVNSVLEPDNSNYRNAVLYEDGRPCPPYWSPN